MKWNIPNGKTTCGESRGRCPAPALAGLAEVKYHALPSELITSNNKSQSMTLRMMPMAKWQHVETCGTNVENYALQPYTWAVPVRPRPRSVAVLQLTVLELLALCCNSNRNSAVAARVVGPAGPRGHDISPHQLLGLNSN